MSQSTSARSRSPSAKSNSVSSYKSVNPRETSTDIDEAGLSHASLDPLKCLSLNSVSRNEHPTRNLSYFCMDCKQSRIPKSFSCCILKQLQNNGIVESRARSFSMSEIHNMASSEGSSVVEDVLFVEFVRIKMKNECIRLWSKEVQNLPDLLCFLQFFHRVKGPLETSYYEKAIESYVNPNYNVAASSWKNYGKHMDVKRMFELGMFELSSPLDRTKVQPVQCILKAKFIILRRGLISEIYKMLANMKKAPIDGIVEELKPYLSGKDESDQLDEVKKTIMSASEVFSIKNSYVELKRDDAFFVITDIAQDLAQ